MKIVFVSLLSLVLASPTIAQNDACKDLSCLVYLLASDPLEPKVAAYIKEHNGWGNKEAGPEIENPAFYYGAEDLKKGSFWEGEDHRELISFLRVNDAKAIDEVLLALGYPKDHGSLKSKYPDKFVKVKKKYNRVSVQIGHDWALNAAQGNFSDCWNGTILYRRNADGELMASEIELFLKEKEKAISYNPVGWHTEDILTTCETGDCTVCNIGKLGNLKGVTIEVKENKFREDKITIDVQNTDIELPMELTKYASQEAMMYKYGFEYPWDVEDGVYKVSTSKNPIKFYFQDEELVKIVAEGIGCSLDFKPILKRINKTVRVGGATPDSPALVEYTGGYTYIGEMKNGVPHGFGTLTGPDVKEDDGPRKRIYGNRFQNGRFNGGAELEKPICISDDCSEKGMVLTEQGLYNGELKDGLPHGFGVLVYTYDLFLQRYQGQFKNGYGVADKGKITYHGGSYYQGAIAGSLPNGNGTLYSEDGKIKGSGFYIDGVKKGPRKDQAKKIVVSRFKYDPAKGSLEGYVASNIAEFRKVQQNKLLADFGKTFAFYARSCGNTIESANVLSDCIYRNHTKHTDGRYKVTSTIEEMWTELGIAIDSPVCYKGEIWAGDVLMETQRLFRKYQSSVDNFNSYYDAAIAQLNTTEAQRDGKLAKTLFSGIVSGISSNYLGMDKYFSDFVNSLVELEKILRGNDCW
ncbi:hypothetical protein [Roseivirga sp. E12]|uniref:hypothetical protein n=1 Tax=Roseivirga sp. E12 TaxID=2819237 RepID=UPI001ABC9048|nr:hypothetical protein [Roseivirga sp. E12]MBO3696988.1 hypothetical protein [Roseivirga sp. E12]